MSATAPTPAPTVGIVGSAGAYGRWLARFFAGHMGLTVLGHDPADAEGIPLEALLAQADVVVFSVPIRRTVEVIEACVVASAGREAGALWLDVTSIKQAPVAAMLASRAEVVGLHPMAAPPKAPTLRGRTLAVCEARLEHWRPWLADLLGALDAQCVHVAPDAHDRAMALVQALGHAAHLAQATVLRTLAAADGGLQRLFTLRTVGYELDLATTTRMLALNPAIYEDLQFCNPHVPQVLASLAAEAARLRDVVAAADEQARARFRAELTAAREAFGPDAVEAGNYTFERLGYLLVDLSGPAVAVRLPRDEAGDLRRLLAAFEQHQVNLASIHSSRTPDGQVHFRIGIEPGTAPQHLQAALQAIDAGLGEVIAPLTRHP